MDVIPSDGSCQRPRQSQLHHLKATALTPVPYAALDSALTSERTTNPYSVYDGASGIAGAIADWPVFRPWKACLHGRQLGCRSALLIMFRDFLSGHIHPGIRYFSTRIPLFCRFRSPFRIRFTLACAPWDGDQVFIRARAWGSIAFLEHSLSSCQQSASSPFSLRTRRPLAVPCCGR
jgi:hypothetical protein